MEDVKKLLKRFTGKKTVVILGDDIKLENTEIKKLDKKDSISAFIKSNPDYKNSILIAFDREIIPRYVKFFGLIFTNDVPGDDINYENPRDNLYVIVGEHFSDRKFRALYEEDFPPQEKKKVEKSRSLTPPKKRKESPKKEVVETKEEVVETKEVIEESKSPKIVEPPSISPLFTADEHTPRPVAIRQPPELESSTPLGEITQAILQPPDLSEMIPSAETSIEKDDGLTEPIGEEVPLVEEEFDSGELNLNFLKGVTFIYPLDSDSDAERGSKFKQYLNILFNLFKLEDKLIKKLLRTDCLNFWAKAFTHSSADPDNNYEVFEAIGDRLIGFVFKRYLYNKYSDITASELNDLENKYMSTIHQSMLSKALHLDKWLIKSDNLVMTDSIEEDLFESFCGAMDQCIALINSNSTSEKKLSTASILYKVIDIIYSDFDFPRGKLAQNPTTIFVQMFERLGYGKDSGKASEFYQTELDGGKWRSELTITNAAIIHLRKVLNVKEIKNKFVVETDRKKKSKNECYAKAVEYFFRIGVTDDYLIELERKKEIGNPYYNQALSKAKKSNPDIVALTMKNYATEGVTTRRTTQIIAIDNSGKKSVLFDKFYNVKESSVGWWSTILKDYNEI